MENLLGLQDWKLNEDVSDEMRFATVTIYLSYIDKQLLLDLSPGQRVEAIQRDFKNKYKQLLALKLFDDHKLVGTVKKPRGVKAMVPFHRLEALCGLNIIQNVFIEDVTQATKSEQATNEPDKFYCVRMTVVIEVEGLSTKKQSIEERFVLIKASSFEDAYQKLESQKDDYADPYLNSSGRWVRWRIESFDDCYETEIRNNSDLERAEGVEVYSKLKTRKII